MTHFITGLKRFSKHIFSFWKITEFPNVDKTARIDPSVKVYNPNNLFMEEKTNINHDAVIMNTRAKFIMKKWSGAAFGLIVVCGGHMSVPGKHHKQITNAYKDVHDINRDFDKDVVVEEDVWIASNVTLLSGVHVGRCSIIGSGSVVRGSVPPYSIVVGNPAKVIGFRFTPQEALIHEESLFPEEGRMSIEELQSNYQRYFVKRIKEIKEYLK